MSSDAMNIDYEAVLADLKAKREKLDAAITGIETMLGIKALSSGTAGGSHSSPKHEGATLGPGAFLGMTIVDATVKLLKAKRQNQRTEDILTALKAGGLALTSSNPINTVGSVLARDWAQGGDIVRVDRGVWGLAEWHPRLRKRPDAKNGSSSSESAEGAPAETAEQETAAEPTIDPLS
jgi:hypothetical protein